MTKRGVTHKTWLTIQRVSKPPQDFDDAPAVWVPVYSRIRGRVIPTSGREVVNGLRITEEITHLVYLRFLPNLDSSMQVVVIGESLPLNINNIVNVQGKSRDLVLTCTGVTQ